MKKFKTLNNRQCLILVRLACQSKWRFLAFALYNFEPYFSDDLKGRIWSIISRCCYEKCILTDFQVALFENEYSIMAPCFNRYFHCYIQYLDKL